jgi:hypothetical protein
MGLIKFDIRHANGQKESIVVEGERALIGSASYCDVRLPMDQTAYEHVLIEAVGATLRAEAKSDIPPPTVNGMPLTASTLTSDTVLGLGQTRLFVTFVPDLVGGSQLGAQRKKEQGPVVQLGLVAMFAVAGYLLLAENEVPIERPPADAPQLFSQTPRVCPQNDPSQANAFAQEQMDLGDTKRERLPFAVKEGVAAVALYEIAAACFTKGDRQSLSREADEAAQTLKRDLTDDFRARRLRLSHLLDVQDYELAKKDVVVLRAMTETKKDRYTRWLATVAEQLKSKR